MAAREDDAASKRKEEEEEDSSPVAADQKADEAAVVDECCDDDDDDLFIRNLNLISRLNLMTPEWIDDTKKLHYDQIDLLDRSYDDLDALDEAGAAEYEEWCKQEEEVEEYDHQEEDEEEYDYDAAAAAAAAKSSVKLTKADETVAGAPAAEEVDECSDDDDDPVIRNLNVLSSLNLMPPGWIENRKKLHYDEIEHYNRAYDALENGDIESEEEAGVAEYEEWSKRLWASVDFSGLNTVGGESCGVDAVAVYPDGVYPPEEDEHDDDAVAAKSSS